MAKHKPDLQGTLPPELREQLDQLKRVVAAGWGKQSLVDILSGMETIATRQVVPGWVARAESEPAAPRA